MSAKRILVVEDNAANRLLLHDLLALRGHEVIEAGSVEEARPHLRPAPDLVVCDLALPGAGGEALLREVRGDQGLAGTPVVLVTASAMHGDRERFLAAGFDAYLSKPIDTRTFASFVEAHFERRRRSG